MTETSGLLNRRTGDSRTEGSNPSVSASCYARAARLLARLGFFDGLSESGTQPS